MIWELLIFTGLPLAAQDFAIERLDKDGAVQAMSINLDNKFSIDGGTVAGKIVMSSGIVTGPLFVRGATTLSGAVTATSSITVQSGGRDIILSTNTSGNSFKIDGVTGQLNLSTGVIVVNGVNRFNPESFCASAADMTADTTITCPTGKVFIGPVIGGNFFGTTTDTSCPASVGASSIPTPNVRGDDDASATSGDAWYVTFGCNGRNSCTVNSGVTGAAGVYLGSCM